MRVGRVRRIQKAGFHDQLIQVNSKHVAVQESKKPHCRLSSQSAERVFDVRLIAGVCAAVDLLLVIISQRYCTCTMGSSPDLSHHQLAPLCQGRPPIAMPQHAWYDINGCILRMFTPKNGFYSGSVPTYFAE